MAGRQIWTNARVVTGEAGTAIEPLDITVQDGRILAVGRALAEPGDAVTDCAGRLITPAFIDCHTHLLHGGDRSGEFEQRLDGVSYQQIAQSGGGIAASMRATRCLDEEGLIRASLPRLDALLAEGVSTVEIKSGYGLDIDSEIRMLRAARALGRRRRLRIRTTWLAAHAMPPGYRGSRADYIRTVAIAGLEQAHAQGLVDAVDAFCESIAFSAEEIAPLFDCARRLGLPVKLHAEQLSRSGGSLLAARYGALSVDHFEYANAEDVAAIAASGTSAVLLPGAFYMLRETQLPPLAALREAGVPVALATDCNPGTSPLSSLLLTMNMAAVLFRMTVRECFDGVTRHAARALGLSGQCGMIAPGLSADFAIWNAASVAELVGHMGLNPLHARVFEGHITHG